MTKNNNNNYQNHIVLRPIQYVLDIFYFGDLTHLNYVLNTIC